MQSYLYSQGTVQNSIQIANVMRFFGFVYSACISGQNKNRASISGCL